MKKTSKICLLAMALLIVVSATACAQSPSVTLGESISTGVTEMSYRATNKLDKKIDKGVEREKGIKKTDKKHKTKNLELPKKANKIFYQGKHFSK